MGAKKTIVVDFGKVLVDYDYDRFVSSIVSDPKERAGLVAVVSSQEFMDLHDLGEMSFIEVIRKAQNEHPQWKDYFQEYYDRQLDIITGEVPGMREALGGLKAQGYKIYGLSNWSDVVYDVIKMYPEIFSLLDDMVISSAVKLIKPDPAIYLHLCSKFGLNPADCVFIDDKAPNIEGARKAGMNAILFKNAEQFLTDLQQYLD